MGHSECTEIQCESCGATLSIRGQSIASRCLFCDNPSVIQRPAIRHRSSPVFALAFTIEREVAVQAVRHWIGRQTMAPFGLKRGAVEKVTGVYIPAYLYSSTARSRYQASIAESYQKTGIRVVSDSQLSLGSRNRTEYHDLTGTHVTYVSDVLVTASHAVSNQELQAIEPFDLSQLRRYSPTLVAGWNAEEPSLSPEESLRVARGETQAWIPEMLLNFMPGDGVRDLRHTTEFLEESVAPTLTPVWVCAIRYSPHQPPLRILVNGQTAKVAGEVPFSWLKLVLMTATGAGILAGLGMAIWLARRWLA